MSTTFRALTYLLVRADLSERCSISVLFTTAPFRLKNIYWNGAPPRSGSTTPLPPLNLTDVFQPEVEVYGSALSTLNPMKVVTVRYVVVLWSVHVVTTMGDTQRRMCVRSILSLQNSAMITSANSARWHISAIEGFQRFQRRNLSPNQRQHVPRRICDLNLELTKTSMNNQ